MPINVFGNSSNISNIKIDNSLAVQKPYLRTNYIESNIEEDIDLQNQYRIKSPPVPISTQEIKRFEIDGQRYPRDSSLMNYEQNNYI